MNGCNTDDFTMDGMRCAEMDNMQRPIWLSVGRVSVEKNIRALLDLNGQLPGTICVVGQGPYFEDAVEKYGGDGPGAVHFLGWKAGADLSAVYRSADVFVFPSMTARCSVFLSADFFLRGFESSLGSLLHTSCWGLGANMRVM